MADLCPNCGHPLPNAAGAGLYCPECGEPIGSQCDWSGCNAVARQHYGATRVHTPTGELNVGGVRVREGTTVRLCMPHAAEFRELMEER